MPFNFTGYKGQAYDAKQGVVDDGYLFVVNDGAGHTVTSKLPQLTIFSANPVRSATGVWSVGLLDSVDSYLDIEVKTVLASGTYLSTQLLPPTTDANGKPVINWVFNVAGTPTDLPSTGSPMFLVHVRYSETHYGF